MRAIAYYRVSTERQGASGLGLQAQRKAVADYLASVGATLLEEYTEIESGKRSDRPEIAKALAACRKAKATLVIAKLDRLARNVAFISRLMEAKVDFLAVDFPQANRLTIHILAAVAEHEREMISQRTKAALAAARARGVKLGSPLPQNGAAIGLPRSLAARKAKADAIAAVALPVIHKLKAEGKTLRQIAEALGTTGIEAPRGGAWWPSTVYNMLARSE
ncbi:MAG: recombinase family protein [Alphaproteobacteria bacterium]